MKPVADTHHLQKRGDLYTFYRRVPKHLVPILGRTFVKKALGVSSLAEAKKLRAIEEVRTNALFDAAEKGLADKGAGTAAQPVSMSVLTEYVREAVGRLDKQADHTFVHQPPADKDQLANMRVNVEQDLTGLRDPADPNAHAIIQSRAHHLATEKGLDVDQPDFPKWELYDLMRRALIELNRRKLDRYSDDHGHPFHDALFDPKRPSPTTFGELCATFIAEQTEEYQANGISQKRIDNVKSKVAMLREIIGESTLVRDIDDDLIRSARVTLAKVPNNRTQIYPKLDLPAAIERGEKDGKPTLAPPTQEFYLNMLRAVLKIGVRKKLLNGNPAEGVRPLVKDTLGSAQKRRPLSADQLKGFFGGAFYKSCVAGTYAKGDRAWRFWVPLVALFSGARPNEICGLTVADFDRTKAGTWFFAVTDEGDTGKTLKTEASRRRVPIHPELVKIGLLGFVEKRRKADGNKARLFPDLKPNKYGNVAWYAVKRLNETFIPAEITLEDRQSLYSLRHNVRDALRRIKASPETLLHVTGWSPAGKAVSDSYGDPGNPDLHAEAVSGIAYPGLDLSFLHGAGA